MGYMFLFLFLFLFPYLFMYMFMYMFIMHMFMHMFMLMFMLMFMYMVMYTLGVRPCPSNLERKLCDHKIIRRHFRIVTIMSCRCTRVCTFQWRDHPSQVEVHITWWEN